jgi:hypothetical protein
LHALAKLKSAGEITWSELKAALVAYGYEEFKSGKTGGSRVKYRRVRSDGTQHVIPLHKPHPAKEIKAYVKRQVCDSLREEGLL